jgi:histidyl-tRNA synthetase
MILAKRAGDELPARAGIAVIALGEAAKERAVPLVAALRRTSGELPITIDYNDAKLATQFKKADRANARVAVILGDDELRSETVVVRDLATRVQDSLQAKSGEAAPAATILDWYRSLPAAVGVSA